MLSKAPSYSTATSSYSCKTDIETQNRRNVKAELLQVGIFFPHLFAREILLLKKLEIKETKTT